MSKTFAWQAESQFKIKMKRRNFGYKFFIGVGSFFLLSQSICKAFLDLKEQIFDFMLQTHPNLKLINNSPLKLLYIFFIAISSYVYSQSKNTISSPLNIAIDKNVLNADGENEKEIIRTWTSYLNSGEFKNPKSDYWDNTIYSLPDYFLWPVDKKSLTDRTPKVQCSILGIYPVENNHYELKTALTHIENDGKVVLEAILSVFAKKIRGNFLLVNSSQYYKEVWQNIQVGSISYYLHPNHTFNMADAQKMNNFNVELAAIFKTKPISFDYFVSNYSREIVRLWGYDYMPKIYIPGQTGGVADINNQIIYAGNNSEYYPHELVHIYTREVFPDSYHFWLDEGFATFMAGSGGYNLEWHIDKLKSYISQNPDFEINIKALKGYIPNGLHNTEYRYVIGGLICKKVYELHGMNGILDGFETVRSDNDFYKFIENKLGVNPESITDYIKKVVLE